MNKLADNLMLLEKRGLTIAPYKVVYRVKAAMDAGDELEYPVVLKLSSDIHKKDIGGVFTHLDNGLSISDAWRKIKRNISKTGLLDEEYLVQKQISGVELIIGLKYDKVFGNVIMLGSGGTFAEIMKDVTFRACPISLKDAQDMIEDIKAFELLKGYRGDKPANISALKDTLFTLSRLHNKVEFTEVDINPIIVNSNHAFIADVRIVNETI